MKLKKIISLMLLAVTACMLCALTACKETTTKQTLPQAIFELEGGEYRNSSYAVKHGYNLEEGQQTYIIALNEVDSKNPVTKKGYLLRGWYKTKTGEGENVTYSDPWDFEKDKMGHEGVTLYAYWEKAINYTYSVGYLNDEGEFKKIRNDSDYKVDKGAKFDDYLKYYNKRSGYTAMPESFDDLEKIAYYDINGNAWDPEFTHPGDDENPDVKVVVEFIKGEVEFVRNKEEFLSAQGEGMYIVNDIDLGGETVCFTDKTGMFQKTYIYGNGHTISNFKLSYPSDKNALTSSFDDETPNSLYVALFGEMKDSLVKDLTLENVTVDLGTMFPQTNRVYFAPVAVYAKDSTVSNLKVNLTLNYTAESFFEGFDMEENLFVETEKAYFEQDDCEFNEVTITVNN